MDKILSRIKQKRLLKGISQSVIARRLNIVSSAYGKIERGQTELTLKRLKEICEVLELNFMELTIEFLKTNKKENSPMAEPDNLSIQEELELSKKINYIFYEFVEQYIYLKYHTEIMEDYPYTEFTAKDWWNSLGENKEEQIGMSEAEFWETYGGGYSKIYKPEDEYQGFKRLVSRSEIFYFFKFGFMNDDKLNSLFEQYLQEENTSGYSLNSKLSASVIRKYLNSLVNIDVYEPQNGM